MKWGSQYSNLKIDFEKVAEGIKNTTGKIRGVITSETKKTGVNIVDGNAEVKEGFVSVDGKELSLRQTDHRNRFICIYPSNKRSQNMPKHIKMC